VDIVAPFGEKYVDQLATAYLAFNEKSHLPTIFRTVAATIGNDFGLDLLGASTDPDRRSASPGFETDQTNPAPIVQESKQLPEPSDEMDLTKAAAKQSVADPPAGTGTRPVDIGEVKPGADAPVEVNETTNLADLFNRMSGTPK